MITLWLYGWQHWSVVEYTIWLSKHLDNLCQHRYKSFVQRFMVPRGCFLLTLQIDIRFAKDIDVPLMIIVKTLGFLQLFS